VLTVGLCVLISAPALRAQISDEYQLQRPANCCLLNTATTLAEQLQELKKRGVAAFCIHRTWPVRP
jgi:hypothetical protein